VTVQQALLLRLRDQALRGELWAEKLLQKVIGALPESGSEHDHVDMRTITAKFFDLPGYGSAHEESDATSNSAETTNAE
jgi:hypothetical protein